MPTSNPDNISHIINIIRSFNPSSMLDIGPGLGKYGYLSREYLEVWNDKNVYKPYWKHKIDCVEAFFDYITPLHKYIYDEILIGDIKKLADSLKYYSLILMVDVLEHLTKEEGIQLIKKLRKKCNCILVCIPDRYHPQEPIYGNKYEEHKCSYSQEEIEKITPYVTHINDSFIFLIEGENIKIKDSEEVKNLYDCDYFLGGKSKITNQYIGVDGFKEFAKGKISDKKIKSVDRFDFKDKTILDIGFGRGEILRYCSIKGAKQCIGMDYSTVACDISRDFNKDLNNIKLYNLPMNQSNQVMEKNIDFLFFFDVFEHVPNNEITECISKLSDKLSPNVILVAETPSRKVGGYLTMHNNYHTENDLKKIISPFFNNIKISDDKTWYKIEATGFKKNV